MGQFLDDPPYNFMLHSAPLRAPALDHFHWHLEIIPKLTRVAGFEWGTGFFINPTPPEEAAKYLRGRSPRIGRKLTPLQGVCYTSSRFCDRMFCGNSSVVEHNLAKVGVAGSNPVSRSI